MSVWCTPTIDQSTTKLGVATKEHPLKGSIKKRIQRFEAFVRYTDHHIPRRAPTIQFVEDDEEIETVVGEEDDEQELLLQSDDDEENENEGGGGGAYDFEEIEIDDDHYKEEQNWVKTKDINRNLFNTPYPQFWFWQNRCWNGLEGHDLQ